MELDLADFAIVISLYECYSKKTELVNLLRRVIAGVYSVKS